MRERLFPRWGAALFALLPLSEILYAPVTGQTVYAAALASLICALVCAGGARLAPCWQRSRLLQWLLALAALWPLTDSLARMGVFLRDTVFPSRPLWSLILMLTICALLTATAGLNRCAMWALPVAWLAGVVGRAVRRADADPAQPFLLADAGRLPARAGMGYFIRPAARITRAVALPAGAAFRRGFARAGGRRRAVRAHQPAYRAAARCAYRRPAALSGAFPPPGSPRSATLHGMERCFLPSRCCCASWGGARRSPACSCCP